MLAFVVLVIAVVLGTALHYAIYRDVNAALAFGAGSLAIALVPALAGLYGGK